MNKKTSIVSLIVIAIIAIIGLFFPQTTQTIKEITKLGSVVSPDIFDHVTLNQNVTIGGTQVSTTSTTATYTLTTKELRKEVSYISWLANVNTTLTTMASTSAPLSLLRTGESYSTYLYNASTTAAATITLAAGTGVDLQEGTGGVVVINGLEVARLTFLKKANSDVFVISETMQVGD